MPLHFSVSRIRRRVDAVASGVIAPEDVAQYLEARLSAGAYDFDQCIDVRQAEVAVDARVMWDAVRQGQVLLKAGPMPPTAIVTTSGTRIHVVAVEIATSLAAEGVRIGVFETRGQADRWLDRGDQPSSVPDRHQAP